LKKPADSTIAIIGAARNIGEFLPRLIEVFAKSFSGFKSVHYIVVENNSEDDTKEVLHKLSQQYSNFKPIFLEENSNKVKFRTERIAIARNAALSELKKFSFEFDYIAVADLDAINLGLTRTGLESCWNYKDWNAIFANQPDGYYDIYALRHELWSPRNFLDDHEKLNDIFGKKIALEMSLFSKRIKIKKDSKIIEVDSAFGGLGIYKSSDILNERYIGLNEFGDPICEHLSVNLGIREKGGRLFINPKMSNARSYNFLTKIKAILYEKFFRNYDFMGID
jgi:glycosyltransferase involved in cell wall biosynthesis